MAGHYAVRTLALVVIAVGVVVVFQHHDVRLRRDQRAAQLALAANARADRAT